VTRGGVFRLRAPGGRRGHEQDGTRYGVVIQADELLGLSTVVVAPTSASAQPATFRPVITIGGTPTRILTEQMRAVDARRLGRCAGRLEVSELQALDEALKLVLAL